MGGFGCPGLACGAETPRPQVASALPLLVARVLADHAHDTLSPHYLALLTNSLDRRSHLHRSSHSRFDPARRRRQGVVGLPRDAADDSRSTGVVGRHLERYPITGQDLHKVQPHRARHMGVYPATVVEVHLVHSAGEGLDHPPQCLTSQLRRHGSTTRPIEAGRPYPLRPRTRGAFAPANPS